MASSAATPPTPPYSDNTILSPQGPKLDDHNAPQKTIQCQNLHTHSLRGAWCNAAASSRLWAFRVKGQDRSPAAVCVHVYVCAAAVVSCLSYRQKLLSTLSWSWLSPPSYCKYQLLLLLHFLPLSPLSLSFSISLSVLLFLILSKHPKLSSFHRCSNVCSFIIYWRSS